MMWSNIVIATKQKWRSQMYCAVNPRTRDINNMAQRNGNIVYTI